MICAKCHRQMEEARRYEIAKERRKKYLRLHELEDMTVAQIARAYEVDDAVVSRIIKKAKEESPEVS